MNNIFFAYLDTNLQIIIYLWHFKDRISDTVIDT